MTERHEKDSQGFGFIFDDFGSRSRSGSLGVPVDSLITSEKWVLVFGLAAAAAAVAEGGVRQQAGREAGREAGRAGRQSESGLHAEMKTPLFSWIVTGLGRGIPC